MKHLILILIIASSAFSSKLASQQLFMEIGRVNTSFNYINEEGATTLRLFSDKSFAYSVGYRKDITENFYAFGAAVYNRYKTFGSDEKYNNSYSWETGYAGISLGMDAEFFKKRGFSAFVRGAIEPQFLLSGTQQINDDVFDIKGVEQFDSPFLFLKGGAGINWCVDTKVALQVKYTQGYGNPLRNSDDGESLKFNTTTINLGLVWSLGSCEYCHNKKYKTR